jgi:hypothetical protein
MKELIICCLDKVLAASCLAGLFSMIFQVGFKIKFFA